MVTSREDIQRIAGSSRRSESQANAEGLCPGEAQTDASGVLLELDAHMIEKMSREEVLAYQEKRHEQIEDKQAQAHRTYDFEHYKEAFVEAGGREKDAEAAYEAQRKRVAAEAAEATNTEALRASRRRIIKSL